MRDIVRATCRDTFEVVELQKVHGLVTFYHLRCICGDPDESIKLNLEKPLDLNWQEGDRFTIKVTATPV